MDKKKFYDITRLGEIVGEKKKEGLALGLTESQIREVWITAFEILSAKHEIGRMAMSQNLRRKTK